MVYVFQHHVHEFNKLSDMTGYMRTIPCSPRLDGNYGVYALDCEMVNNKTKIALSLNYASSGLNIRSRLVII